MSEEIALQRIAEAARTESNILDLSQLDLVSLPQEIGDLKGLNVLELPRNHLTELPGAMRKLRLLTKLFMGGNRLAAVPEVIGELSELTVLTFDWNAITEVPEFVGGLTKLEAISLSNNRITSIPDAFGDLTGIASLELSGNPLATVPTCIGDLTELRQLLLSHNGLTVVPDFIGNLTELEELVLSDNRLTAIPESLGGLTNLTNLELAGNRLTTVPDFIGNLANLQLLTLFGNPLPSEILAAADNGVPALQGFLRLLRSEGQTVNEGKLVLVGEGEVGKSTLLAALRDEPFVANRSSTHGIEVKPLSLPGDGNKSEDPITLNAWDFGGQRIYRPTHQLFFTAPAVYLVVWKPRQGPEQGFVDYWIDLIRRRAGDNVQIHVVATHGSQTGRYAHLDETRLRERHGDIIAGFHHIDSATGFGIPSLRSAINATALTLPHLSRKLPARWLDFQQSLRDSGEPYLDLPDYLARAARHGLDEQSAKSIARVATELGYWCYYPDTEGLDDLVVLKPNWLSTAVSLVLDDPETNHQHGLVAHHRLREIWNNPARPPHLRYDPRVHQVLLRLMEQYDISYRIRSEAAQNRPTSLVAQLVREAAPSLDEWESFGPDLNELTRICEFVDANDDKVLPEALIYRLIVQLHRFSLGRDDHAKSVHWRHGMVLDRDTHGRALIRIDRSQVIVSVKAAYPQFFLDQITEDIRGYVKNFWPGLSFRSLIPCGRHCEATERPGRGQFEVANLIRRKVKGKSDTECRACGEDLSIDDLVNGVKTASSTEERVARAVDEVVERRIRKLHASVQLQTAAIEDMSVVMRARLSHQEELLQDLMGAVTDEAAHGPRLFTVESPSFRAWSRASTHLKLKVRLWCEHSRLPLHILEDDESSGVYSLDVPKDWLVKSAPWINAVGVLLRYLLPVGMSALKLGVDKAHWAEVEERIKFGEESLKLIADVSASASGESEAFAHEATGSRLRMLHSFLQEKDPGFGGLERVRDRGKFIWVHPQFVREYDPGLPEIPDH